MKKAIPIFTFIGLSFLWQSTVTNAQSSSNKEQHALDEIVIEDSRLQIPFPERNRDIVVLDTEVIKSLPVHSVNELLSYVAGIDIRQRGPQGGQADISINGGTFDETLVLLNGIKVIDPQTGHNMLNLPVSLTAIDRIEILKGAAASAYGINAMNGVINIITKQPEQSGILVSVDAGSSFARDSSNQKLYGAIGADVSAALTGKKTKHFLSFSTRQSSGYRYNTTMNNDKAYYQNQMKLGNKSSLQMMGGFVYNDFGANGFYAPPGDVESKEILQTGIAAIKGNFQPKPGWTLRPSVSYRYNHDDYIFIRQKPSVYENKHFTNVVDVSLNNNIRTAIGNLGIGLEYRKESINSNSLGDWSRDNYGFYAEFAFNKIRKLNIHAGAYLNYSPYFGWQLLPSVDAGYQLNDHWRLFANAGTGTRLPTYTDWYYKGPENIGNPHLKPENAFHAEGGIKFNNQRLQASASYFYRVTDNFIDWVKDSLNGPWQPQNFQKINMPGISFSADYRLLQGATEKGISIISGLSYSWLNPHISSQNNQEFGYSHYALENLKNQIVARFNIGFLNYFNATITGRYEQRVNYKDYLLMDARLSGTFSSFQASISWNNLTNVTYIEAGAVPMPGSWLSVGLKWALWK